MNISEVRVKLVSGNSERLRAFCSVTLDGSFVIRDLKVIEGTNGPFVAMPSRKLTDRCPSCGCKNHLRSRFCNECGGALRDNRAPRDDEGRVKLHADVAHPVNAECREIIQDMVIAAYEEEVGKASKPGYQAAADYDVEDEFSDYDDFVAELRESPALSRSGPRPPRQPDNQDEWSESAAAIERELAQAETRPERTQRTARKTAPAPTPAPARKAAAARSEDDFASGIL